MKKSLALIAIIMSISTILCGVALAEASPLKVVISQNKNYFSQQDNIDVNVTITNVSDEALTFLRWHLPSAKHDNDVFNVKHNGVPVNYRGRLIRYAAPTAKDFLVLKAGEKYIASVELSKIYDMNQSGDYEIHLNIDRAIISSTITSKQYEIINSLDSLQSASITSNTLSFWAEGSSTNNRLTQHEFVQLDINGNFVNTQSCSNSERSQINRASIAAEDMAQNASSYFNGSIGTRYTTWFGRKSSSRQNRVKNNFLAILGAIRNKPVVYNCDCNEDYYAYVYPNRPYKVYLCNTFWRVPNSGPSSKADTIIHEVSHFNVVAGTDDVVYGQRGSKNLAQNSPNRAIRNADNYSFFAALP